MIPEGPEIDHAAAEKVMIRKSSALLLVALLALVLPGRGSAEETLSATLEPGPFEITKHADGYDRIELKGYRPMGSPGEPDLPARVFNFLLPPDTILESVSLETGEVRSDILPGAYRLKAGAPDAALTRGKLLLDWGREKAEVVQGKNQRIYGGDGFYPPAPAKVLPCSQLRKWKYARVWFFPFQFNPATGQLRIIRELRVQISFRLSSRAPSAAALSDTVFDHLAPKLFHNYAQERGTYAATRETELPGAIRDFVIITSQATVSGSANLSAYVAHKEAFGHSVLVVTEADFGSLSGQPPNQRAEKIRQWLIQNYLSSGVVYVLLVGNPSPHGSPGGEGDVPMKMCGPRRGQGSDEESPTDAFFADLTGNWDPDGNGIYGEWSDFEVSGGVDLAAEVWVGRIPVYAPGFAALDDILQKIMDYERQSVDPLQVEWRRNVLLPMSFSTPTYDGAPLAEQMHSDFLALRGYAPWRQYQQGNGPCSLDSTYAGEEELRGGSVVRNRWQGNPFGIVCWWGHGDVSEAGVGCEGCWDGLLLAHHQTAALDDTHPAFTYQCSCLNGYPENPDNLQYALLRQGGIATVSSTRVSWFNTGVEVGQFDGSSTNSGIGYEYVSRLTLGMPAGKALFEAKLAVVPDIGTRASRLMNQFDFNLYGDPSVGIGTCQTDQECEDGDWCNGIETCRGGICRAGGAVDCNDGNTCTLDRCEENEDRCEHRCSASGQGDPCCEDPACEGTPSCQGECVDLDQDGYGNPPSSKCSYPQADCRDLNPSVNTGMTEIPGNGVDDDCNPDTPPWGTPSSIGGAGREPPSHLENGLLAFLLPLALLWFWKRRVSRRAPLPAAAEPRARRRDCSLRRPLGRAA